MACPLLSATDKPGVWSIDLSPEALTLFADHRLGGTAVMPGAALVELALTAANTQELSDIRFEQVCVLATAKRRPLQALVVPEQDGLVVRISGTSGATYASARVGPTPAGSDADIMKLALEIAPLLPSTDLYTAMRDAGNFYGPAFRSIRSIGRRADEAYAVFEEIRGTPWLASSLLIDGAIQLAAAAAGMTGRAFAWAGCDHLRIARPVSESRSAYARRRAGTGLVDVVLLGPGERVTSYITGVRLHALRTGDSRHVLPDIGEIAHLHRYETDFLYDEIFVQHAYLRHGITLEPGDTVFDIGANIGMFTMYVAHRYPGVRVYAFEPAEPAYARLAENIDRHCSSGQAFHYGIADVDGLLPFTFYRNSTIFSGFNADYGRDEAVIRTVVENTLRRSAGSAAINIKPIADRLLRDRLASEVQPTATKTLSTVLREIGVSRIDLLKIDTEGGEMAVLRGIADADWKRIRQVVLETHGGNGERARVAAVLESHGFRVTVDQQEDLLRGTELTTVFARRT